MLIFNVVYGMFFKCLNIDFVGSTNTINTYFIDNYIFISLSGCVSSGSSARICPGSYNAVKKALGQLRYGIK